MGGGENSTSDCCDSEVTANGVGPAAGAVGKDGSVEGDGKDSPGGDGVVECVSSLDGDEPVLLGYTGLQIYLPCFSADGWAPVETAAALFALRFAGVPAAWVTPVLVPCPAGERAGAVQVRLPSAALPEAQLPAALLSCHLPAAHLPAERLCVAGLCAVLRRAVRTVERLRDPSATHYTHRDDGLLGFRRGCLAPPAEASIFTKFCERDVPSATRRLLARLSELSTPPAQLEVPPELFRFENHMQQPLRVHNVWKQEQRAGGGRAGPAGWRAGEHRTRLQHVRHVYAEGHVLTVADLLLYPCLRVMTRRLRSLGLQLESAVPTLHAWLCHLALIRRAAAAWDAVFDGSADIETPPQRGVTLTLPQVTPESLYKKDPSRYKPKKRQFTVQSEVGEALARLETAGFRARVVAHPGSGALQLDWTALPVAASPAEGGLPAGRLARKQQQLESQAWLAVRAARPGDTLVDFCSGGGHLGLLLATLLPRCHVVLVENKEESLRRAQDRLDQLALTNVSLYQCNLDLYRGAFQLGVSLHACGVATDLVMERCFTQRAAFVCCPCCYGAVQNYGPVGFPRSGAGRRTGATSRHWLVLGHAADQTHADGSVKSAQGRQCMGYVDTDRALRAAELGYTVLLTVAEPPDCSNKNHLLVGVPPGWQGNMDFLSEGIKPEDIVTDGEQAGTDEQPKPTREPLAETNGLSESGLEPSEKTNGLSESVREPSDRTNGQSLSALGPLQKTDGQRESEQTDSQ